MRALTMMQAQWRAEAQTGETLTFEHCKGGYFSDREEYGLRVTGKTAQDGTPTPESPLPVRCVKAGTVLRSRGTNLIPYPYYDTTKTVNGITFTDNGDGSVTVNGTATGTAEFVLMGKTGYGLSNYAPFDGYGFEYDTDYSLYSGVVGVISQWNTVYVYWDSTGTMFGAYDKPTLVHVSGGTSAKYRLCIRVNAGAVLTDVVVQPQMVLGSAIQPYEPYMSPHTITTPCDLYEGDIWYPASGTVIKATGVYTATGQEIGWPEQDYFVFEIFDNGNGVPRDVISNGYKTGWLTPSVVQRSNGNGIVLYDDRYTDIADVNAWFAERMSSGDPVRFVYKLAAPVTEHYDPQPLPSHPGTVVLEQIPTDLRGTLGGTMLVRR